MSIVVDMNCDVHLHAEIELLKQAVVDKQTQLIAMETACLRESDRQVELEDSIIAWQDKYDRLYESHKRVQKVNQNLEDKLLKLVDRNSSERAQLTSDVATLSVRLAQANYNIATLQREIERYKTDMGLAIQLLQCKPDSFVSQKVTSLPLEMQSKVTQYMRLDTQSQSDSEGSVSGVGLATSGSYRVLPASDSPPPMCPFPPTAMVYSMRGLDDDAVTPDALANDSASASAIAAHTDMISPSIMAKYLQDELKASEIKHCDTCLCASGSRDLTVLADTAHSYSIGTQTTLHGDANNALCLRCNSNLNSPSRTNSPYIMKLVKSSDSVISETKSSYSGSLNALNVDKLYSPIKKDDLTVNPILGHHRLCDRLPAQMQREAVSVELQIENEIRGLSGKPMLNGTTGSGSMMRHQQQKDTLCDGGRATAIDCGAVAPNDTASGSTNSLWSKTSSNNNHVHADGSKMFETFNRNLIKSIKADNPKVAGPRLCALRIQNGTSNILLDNIESNISPVVYTRRTRLLDEELDETKDVITSPCSPTIPLNFVGSPLLGDGDNNKTDYEKCREGKPVSGDAATLLRKDLLSGSSMSICNTTHDRSPQLAPVVLSAVKHHHTSDTTPSSQTANKSGTQSSSVSTNEPDIQETAILRRQQLNRVAEWVQNNHLDGVQMEGGRNKSDGDSVASLDSGYKTKVNNNLSQCDEDVDESQKVTPRVSSRCDDIKLYPQDYAQNHSNNNVMTGQRPLVSGGDTCSTTEPAPAQIDFAQMEYNVKQFLLKQNEWSIKGPQQPLQQQQLQPSNPHRTETNL